MHPKLEKLKSLLLSEQLILLVLLGLLAINLFMALQYFGFVYTDIDQTVLWNGALEYSRFIFHEPYFYGQPYNFMMEALLAVPLVWAKVPVYMALPIITALVSLLPYLILTWLFYREKHFFWACLTLCFPIILPSEYSLLTTLPRGFVQAQLFIPLLFIPFFKPLSNRHIYTLYLGIGICYLANPSAAILVLPILLYVFSYQYKRPGFYLKSLLVLPFLWIDFAAKNYYKIHPEKVRVPWVGPHPDLATFTESLERVDHFRYLFPFVSEWGLAYFLLFIGIAVLALVWGNKKVFWLTLMSVALLIYTLAVGRIQYGNPDSRIFFTPSRLYLSLPLLFILLAFLLFRNRKTPRWLSPAIAVLAAVTILFQAINFKGVVNKTMKDVYFPVSTNAKLEKRAEHLAALAMQHNVDLIVHASTVSFDYTFDAYAFHPLNLNNQDKIGHVVSVNVNGDRRSWLYDDALHSNRIILNGFSFEPDQLEGFSFEKLDENLFLFENPGLPTKEFLAPLNLNFSLLP